MVGPFQLATAGLGVDDESNSSVGNRPLTIGNTNR
jgi:hypothetical protein